ncbi:MAG TPA: bacterial transcriptional activator domain-containing protein [Ktedonobacteraceae bacterium]|nr:bacterial transcriptional activator domain-containing protein [Ktedonobacteraceae bacterium]
MTIDTSTLDAPRSMRSFQFLSLAGMAQVPAPLVRITTCGLLTLEIFDEVVSSDPLQARYRVLTPDLLHGRGVIPALTLLKLLSSRPERFAPSEWLREQFCQAQGEAFSSKRLDSLATFLRDLLCPPAYEALRTDLVSNIRAMSGSGYRLASYPLIWVDHEALAWNVEQAIRLERFGDDPLPFWQRAYELAKRGEYLPDELYGEWASVKREQVAGMLRQSVQALARLYSETRDKASEEESLLLLRTYWQEHPHDEDALRPLMELLGRRECYQEALGYYEKLCALLEEEGEQPDSHTQNVVAYLQAKQLQRRGKQMAPCTAYTREASRTNWFFPSLHEQVQDVFAQNAPSPQDEHARTNHPIASLSGEDLLCRTDTTDPYFSLLQTDMGVFTQLATLLNASSVVSEREIIYFEQQTRLYWRAREETALPTRTLYTYVLRHLDDIQMLLARPHPSVLRSYLCEIICRTGLLAGILLYDMGYYEKARQAYRAAFQAATEAHHPLLQAIIWGWMSFTWTYHKQYQEALACVQRARSYLKQTAERVVGAWLGAIEAEIHAHLQSQDACLQALMVMESGMERVPSQEITYLFEFNPNLLLGYKGVCLQQFYRRQEPATYGFLHEAKEALEQALVQEAPLKRHLYYGSDLACVYARQGEVEKACMSLLQIFPLMTQLGDGTKTLRKHVFQARSLLQPYKETLSVQALDEQIVSLLGERTREHLETLQ